MCCMTGPGSKVTNKPTYATIAATMRLYTTMIMYTDVYGISDVHKQWCIHINA